MERVRVVGSAGSGKTVTALEIARRLRIPHLELDSLHWLAGWEERDAEEFQRMVLDFVSQPKWVVDGNYTGRLGRRIDHLVDTYVWLDLPRWRVVTSVLARTLRRWVWREDLWGTGNRERLAWLFKTEPTENIVLWSWSQHHRHRDRYAAMQREGDHRWVRLRSRREVARFLETIEPPKG